jgi:hypothetical protein
VSDSDNRRELDRARLLRSLAVDQKDRELETLHETTQRMVKTLARLEQDLRLVVMPPDFADLARQLLNDYLLARPLLQKHQEALTTLRGGRLCTVAGITGTSQTQCVVLYAREMLEHVAQFIPAPGGHSPWGEADHPPGCVDPTPSEN